MSSVSGLSAQHRIRARDLAVQAAMLLLHNAAAVHYSQDLRKRWQGIDRDMKAWQGEFPRNIDCSSAWTWCIWNGLDHFGCRDTVNGLGWHAGNTDSMLGHGKPVVHRENMLRADLVIYRGHVAGVVGRRAGDGKPMVVSQGSERGPFLLPYDYRKDIVSIRRYI